MAGQRVVLTEIAERTLIALRDQARARQDTNSFRGTRDLLFELENCADPFTPARALVGGLSTIFQIDNGVIRVYYTRLGSTLPTIAILHIAHQITPASAPYSVFAQLILSGRYDDLFRKLGEPVPDECQNGTRPTVQ
jgi:hypothetical protein